MLIQGQPASTFVPQQQEMLYDQEEELLDKFSQNYDYHSASYNSLFNSVIYSDICKNVPELSATSVIFTACESYNQQILTKGLYSSVIQYWDYMRQLNYDFSQSSRNQTQVWAYLNDNRLRVGLQMEDYYFKASLALLVKQFEADIDYL